MIENTLSLLNKYLEERTTKPGKDIAFGQYVGFTLAEMPLAEQNYKKIKIVEILSEDFP